MNDLCPLIDAAGVLSAKPPVGTSGYRHFGRSHVYGQETINDRF